MKKILYVAMMAIASVVMLTACGGSNEKKTVNVDGEEVVVSQEVADLDLQGISDLVKKNSSEVTSDDYDFIIDQLEILNNKTGKMSKEEFKVWQDSLSNDDKGVVITLGMMAAGMQKRAELTDSQRERLNKVMTELEQRD